MSTAGLSTYRDPRTWLLLGLFLLVVLGVGGFIGASAQPAGWYDALEKPPFNPPNWIFGPVWSTLYVLIAVAGWRTALRDPGGTPMKLWFVQMALNWAWTPIWFTLHLLWPAFAVIAVILAAIIAFIALSWRHDRVAAWLFVPYACWVGFASVLNFSVALLN